MPIQNPNYSIIPGLRGITSIEMIVFHVILIAFVLIKFPGLGLRQEELRLEDG